MSFEEQAVARLELVDTILDGVGEMTFQAKNELVTSMDNGSEAAIGLWLQRDQKWLPTPQGNPAPRSSKVPWANAARGRWPAF